LLGGVRLLRALHRVNGKPKAITARSLPCSGASRAGSRRRFPQRLRIITGDLFDVLPTLDAESIDACVTDPPYGIGFMGKEWDSFSPLKRRSARLASVSANRYQK
jgi:hypothetical protein